jgi:hypothetical protein
MAFLPSLSFSILPLLFHISFIHTIFLPSLFSISPRSIVSLSSEHILHFLSSPSVQYLFALSSFPHLNLAIIFLSFALFLPVRHFSYSLLILSLLSCLSVSLSLSLSYTFIHLPFALNLFTSSLHARSSCSNSLSLAHPRSFSFLYSTL